MDVIFVIYKKYYIYYRRFGYNWMIDHTQFTIIQGKNQKQQGVPLLSRMITHHASKFPSLKSSNFWALTSSFCSNLMLVFMKKTTKFDLTICKKYNFSKYFSAAALWSRLVYFGCHIKYAYISNGLVVPFILITYDWGNCNSDKVTIFLIFKLFYSRSYFSIYFLNTLLYTHQPYISAVPLTTLFVVVAVASVVHCLS